jgi:predicted nucleotidyltransferase
MPETRAHTPTPSTLEQLQQAASASILFECVAGSQAYGTAMAGSDEDVRGIFALPAHTYLNLAPPPAQLADPRGNTVFYSLRRAIELLGHANPSLLELLFMPEDCLRRSSPEMEALCSHRQLFITRECARTHAGYAMSQIGKARGQNKWINNPRPATAPAREDHCYILPSGRLGKPVPLKETGWSLDEHHAARLEHAQGIYRLYHYGPGARGVFRGGMLVCESIPQGDEMSRFAGLLLYNEQSWKQALSEHHSYWEWRANRNDARWRQQERGELDFDAKNMMHTVRLLLSGRSILLRGEPMVRFQGDDLALLRSIREGHRSFEEIMSLAQQLMADCERLAPAADLPESCDLSRATALLQQLTAQWEDRIR